MIGARVLRSTEASMLTSLIELTRDEMKDKGWKILDIQVMTQTTERTVALVAVVKFEDDPDGAF